MQSRRHRCHEVYRQYQLRCSTIHRHYNSHNHNHHRRHRMHQFQQFSQRQLLNHLQTHLPKITTTIIIIIISIWILRHRLRNWRQTSCHRHQFNHRKSILYWLFLSQFFIFHFVKHIHQYQNVGFDSARCCRCDESNRSVTSSHATCNASTSNQNQLNRSLFEMKKTNA